MLFEKKVIIFASDFLLHIISMFSKDITQQLTQVVDQLSEPESLKGLFHEHQDGAPLPSAGALQEVVNLTRAIIFPGFYGKSHVHMNTLRYHIGVNVEQLHKLLSQQILAGLCFKESCPGEPKCSESAELQDRSRAIAAEVVDRLPSIREVLSTDVEAAYEGDPAAGNHSEVIACYPVIKALTNFRLAHELYLLNVPLIPRMLTEMAHSETGIDIHPAATIGRHFTIDHGTGVVIGATCIIGNNVKLYQGVTLGAKSFPLDSDGNPIKVIPRHPIIEDDVVIYANATILGRITIGKGSVVGANVWVTRSMRPNTKKYKKVKQDNIDIEFENGTGI